MAEDKVKLSSDNESVLKITEDIRSTDLISNYTFPLSFPIVFGTVKYEVKITNTNESIYKMTDENEGAYKIKNIGVC